MLLIVVWTLINMKSLFKIFFLLGAVFCSNRLMAQFAGGAGDGFTNTQFSKQNINDANAFKGGSNDGFSASTYNRQNINDANAFKGGSNDGFSSVAFNRQNANDSNAFKGGSDDGFSAGSFTRINLNDNNAFKGGSNDGFSVFVLNRKNIADSNAFRGGANDGFTFSVYLKNATLPVNLIDFSGRWDNNTAVLSWHTPGISDAARFIIERSFTGNNDFIPAGTQPAAPNSNSSISYVFNDSAVASVFDSQKYFFYRLKMIDRAGNFTYSAYVLLVKERGVRFTITLFPNPASTYVNVSVDGLNDHEPLNIYVYDLNGKLITQRKMRTNSEKLDTYQLSPGQYFISVYDHEQLLKTIPVIIQH